MLKRLFKKNEFKPMTINKDGHISIQKSLRAIVDIDIGSKIVLKEALVSGEECGKGSTFTYEVL